MKEVGQIKQGSKIRGHGGDKYREGLDKRDVYDTMRQMRDRLKTL
jgi:hypothetical protein